MDAERFVALGERNRLRIVEMLAAAPRPVGEIAYALGLRQPQVTKHLQTLEQAGLVQAHPLGRRRIYSLQRAGFTELGAWLTRLGHADADDTLLASYRNAIADQQRRLTAGLAPRPVRLRRRIEAPVTRVWAAWTQAAEIRHWWAPDHFRVASCRLEARVGGRLTIVLAEGDGRRHRATGRFHAVDEPHRLAFELNPVGDDGQPLFRLVHTVSLRPEASATVVSLRLQPSAARPDAAAALAGVRPGWQQSLERLATRCRLPQPVN